MKMLVKCSLQLFWFENCIFSPWWVVAFKKKKKKSSYAYFHISFLFFLFSVDHSRIRLQLGTNDYINASLITVEEARRNYILTQVSVEKIQH